MVVAWRSLFGIELFYEEHETLGEPFLKQRRTWQYEFHNPAVNGYGVIPQSELSPSTRAAFMEFCAVRYGIDNVELCYRKICKGTLNVDVNDGCAPYSSQRSR